MIIINETFPGELSIDHIFESKLSITGFVMKKKA